MRFPHRKKTSCKIAREMHRFCLQWRLNVHILSSRGLRRICPICFSHALWQFLEIISLIRVFILIFIRINLTRYIISNRPQTRHVQKYLPAKLRAIQNGDYEWHLHDRSSHMLWGNGMRSMFYYVFIKRSTLSALECILLANNEFYNDCKLKIILLHHG